MNIISNKTGDGKRESVLAIREIPDVSIADQTLAFKLM